MNWNLILAWMPLVAVGLLVESLKTCRWLSPRNLALTLFWLVFLPNSFYLVSDFVHLNISPEANLLYDGVMLMSYALSGLILAWTSVWFMHRELRRRLSERETWYVLLAVFFICGFAVYMGRFLGWNSWDIIVDPFSILFDVSDRVINPASYSNTFETTLLFFVFIAGTYYGFQWYLNSLLSPSSKA